jgi:hypothetical protein
MSVPHLPQMGVVWTFVVRPFRSTVGCGSVCTDGPPCSRRRVALFIVLKLHAIVYVVNPLISTTLDTMDPASCRLRVMASSPAGTYTVPLNLIPLLEPIDSLQRHPRNARQGDIGAIVESLRRFGQLKPIVVQESTRYIVAGNHLYAAAETLGWTHVAATVVTMDDATAQAYMIADNRTSDLGSYDESVLTELLAELATAGDLAGTGYDGDDVDEMLAKLDWKASGGNPVIQYVLIFDDEDQQNAWHDWLRALRRKYPDDPEGEPATHAARIIRAITS